MHFNVLVAVFLPMQFSAPSNVFVTGNLNVTEGDSISLKCEHQSSFPVSNGSVFCVDGARTYVEEVNKWV